MINHYWKSFAASLLLITSCSPDLPIYTEQSYSLGKVDSCAVGDNILSTRNGVILPKIGDLERFYGRSEELVYGGISSNVIQVYYREYFNDRSGQYIRPAFSMSVQYDLNQDRDIAFRNFRIRIVDATPSQVRFIVQSDSSTKRQAQGSEDSPPGLLPIEARRHVNIKLKNGSIVQGFIVAETSERYYLSYSITSKDLSKPLKKSAVEKVELIK